MEYKKNLWISAKLLIAVLAGVFVQSCAVVAPYEMQKLNDSEMELSSLPSEKFETSFQVYREGAAGANGGKSGGGCGCN